MYRTPVIIEKISPDRANRTPTRSGGVLLRHEGAYFTIMTGKVLYIIPLITRLLAKTKQFIYNVFVTSIHSVDQQRNSPPKTLTSSLSNRQRLGWYISRLLHWQVTGLHAKWYQRQKIILFTLRAVITHPLPMNYPKIIDRRKLWSAHASERNVEKTCVIITYNPSAINRTGVGYIGATCQTRPLLCQIRP